MALLRREPKRRRGVVASAHRVKLKDESSNRLRTQDWQARAWLYYDTVGEYREASQFYSRSLAPLRLYVAKWDDTQNDWVEIKSDDPGYTEQDGQVLGLWDRVQDPGGGRSQLLGNYGRQRFVAGESYLTVTGADDPAEPEVWEMLSTDELIPEGDGWRRRYRPGEDTKVKEAAEDTTVPMPDQAVVYRMWRPHPRFSRLADSPTRAVLDVAEELVMLTAAIRARARSRLAGAGLLLIPDDVDFEEEQDEDQQQADQTDAEQGPFERMLTAAMTTAIEDQGDASAVVPVTAFVPADSIDKWRLIDFGQGSNAYPEVKLRDEAVTRLARGLDMPVEILLGLAQANHWTGWMIHRQTWQVHVQPVAEEMVDDFTGIYLRPAIAAAGIAVESVKYRIWYDESKVVTNPDRSRDAKDLHKAFAISDESLREANGFTDDDAPEDDEITRRVEILSAIRSHGQGTSTTGQESAPAQQPDGQQASADGLAGAMALAVERCRELAGSRLRTRLQRGAADPSTRELLDGVPNRLVAETLGMSHPLARQVAAGKLVEGGSECLAGWMADRGYPQDWIEETCRTVEDEAARGLWRARVKLVG